MVQSLLGKRVAGISPNDTVGGALALAFALAYRGRSQFVKWLGPMSQHAFVKKNPCVTVLSDGSFGVNLNEVRKHVRKMYGGERDAVDTPELVFDSNYATPNGVLHDVLKITGVRPQRELPPMVLEDAQVYIARWGGQPGAERFKTPYGIK